MSWIFVAVIAYFLVAVANLIDKYVLKSTVKDPLVYAFLVCALGGLAVLLFPFGLYWPGNLIGIMILSGVTYVFALSSHFHGLFRNDASKILPFIGGLQPIFIFTFSYFFLGEHLGTWQKAAFVLLLIGSILISLDFSSLKTRKNNGFEWAALAALLYAISYTSAKFAYNHHPFISAFIWIRIFSLLAALALLFLPGFIFRIKDNFRKERAARTKPHLGIIAMGQITGAISFILIQRATQQGSVTLVNAMQGLAYVFLFVMALVITIYYPKFIKEQLNAGLLFQKITAIILIIAGLVLLAVNI